VKRLGRYVLEAPLGGGGIATLHRARDERTGTAVAIKVLRSQDDPVVTNRFWREAETIGRIEHPNVVRVLDFALEADQTLYLVLELLDGEPLGEVIAREGRLPASRAGAIADQVLAALSYCHGSGVVHRDVKPSNVMILKGDVVKLIDFGLVKVGPDVAQKLTETGTVHGTPHYMSPEQCRGEDVEPASDIYSAGVLLYEMLAGKTPFAGSDAATLMAAHLFVDPPELANVAPGVAAAVRGALAKRPEDRPTASTLRTWLRDALTGEDPVTRAGRDVEQRVDHLAKPREERALGGSAKAVGPARGIAFVATANDARAASILSCLGTAGIDARLAGSDPSSGGLTIVSGIEALRRFRDRDAKSAVIVVDVGGPDETTEAIRLHADDMLLASAPDADLVAKVHRVLRRRSRS
jgi:serine/threonine protein kinase